MALELECKIVRKLAVQTGRSARGDWEKQEFIVEYRDGNYPNQVCMNVWGADKVKDLENFQVGDEVKASFNLSSREFNGRWYTDIRVWKMERKSTAPQQPASRPVPSSEPYRPAGDTFRSAPANEAPAYRSVPLPTEEDLPAGGSFEDDDLPF